MRVGIIAGIILGLVFALAVTSIVSLFAPVGGLRNLWIFLVALVVCALLFGGVVGWLGLWLGRMLGVLVDLLNILTAKLPRNYYGICTGHTKTPDGTNLTDWLSDAIDSFAGLKLRTSPLTFGQLLKHDKPINLKMVTTNLSHIQPYILPEGLYNFIFNEKEMQDFFPDYTCNTLLTLPLPAMLQHDPSSFPRKRCPKIITSCQMWNSYLSCWVRA